MKNFDETRIPAPTPMNTISRKSRSLENGLTVSSPSIVIGSPHAADRGSMAAIRITAIRMNLRLLIMPQISVRSAEEPDEMTPADMLTVSPERPLRNCELVLSSLEDVPVEPPAGNT